MIKGLNTLRYEMTMAHDIRFDPDEGTPDYIGLNPSTDASTDAVNWVVYKFTYTSGVVTRIQKSTGSWDNRSTLF